MSSLPEYVEFGFRSSYPGPFKCRSGDMKLLVLQGDGQRIAQLVERTLTLPAKGAIEYRPLGSRVILLYGFNLVSSAIPPSDAYGAVREMLASFWVPVWAGHSRDGIFQAKRLCMTVPFILVDNPMSLVAGREIYGFPKALGRFTKSGERVLIEGYGGTFDPQAVADWRRLIEILPVGDGDEAHTEVDMGGTAELIDALGRELIDGNAGDGLDLPGVRLASGLCRLARKGRVCQVFLKQFRDAVEHTGACYQRVVEAPAEIRKVEPARLMREWDVTIGELDSHPIVKELGVESQRTRWSAHLRAFEFDVLQGEIIKPVS